MGRTERNRKFVLKFLPLSAMAAKHDQWIGPDPMHISYEVVTKTTDGIVETATFPVDVSILPANTEAADESHKISVLLSPYIIAELTKLAEEVCGEFRSERDQISCKHTTSSLLYLEAMLLATATDSNSIAACETQER